MSDMHPNQFVPRVSEMGTQRVIGKSEMPREIGFVIAVRHLFDDRAIPFLGLPDLLLHCPAFGYVACHPPETDGFASSIADQSNGHGKVGDRSVSSDILQIIGLHGYPRDK